MVEPCGAMAMQVTSSSSFSGHGIIEDLGALNLDASMERDAHRLSEVMEELGQIGKIIEKSSFKIDAEETKEELLKKIAKEINRTRVPGFCAYNLAEEALLLLKLLSLRIAFLEQTKDKKANIKKHGVSFDEARTVFYDKNATQFFDPAHSENEDRFILLGMSFKLRVLVVCHCFRKSETVVRIFSARKADKEEEHEYWRLRK